MITSETRRDAEILVRNPSPRVFSKKFRDSKKVKTNRAKTRLQDFSKMLLRFCDPAKIFREPRFSKYHSPHLLLSLSGHFTDLRITSLDKPKPWFAGSVSQSVKCFLFFFRFWLKLDKEGALGCNTIRKIGKY